MTKIELLTMMDADLDKTVKIQGTDYDRKRKIGKSGLKRMQTLLKKGKTYQQVAEALGCSTTAVRYNTDADFRTKHLAGCTGKHTGKDHVTIENRIQYKRALVAEGKVTA